MVCGMFNQDVRDLVKRLSCVVSHYEIPNWQHLDFIWGLDAAQVLYSRIIGILRQAAVL